MWTVGLTVEIKLRFQISLAQCSRCVRIALLTSCMLNLLGEQQRKLEEKRQQTQLETQRQQEVCKWLAIRLSSIIIDCHMIMIDYFSLGVPDSWPILFSQFIVTALVMFFPVKSHVYPSI